MRRIILLALFLVLALSPKVSFAAPAITNLSGTVSNSESITITGTDFGANGPTVTYFNDFESGSNGVTLTTGDSVPVGSISYVATGASCDPYYTNATSVSGSLAHRSNVASTCPNGGFCYSRVALPSGTMKLFVSYWVLAPASTPWPGEGGDGVNWKIMWVQGEGTADDDLTFPTMLPTTTVVSANSNYYISQNGSEGWASPSWTKGEWKRVWAYIIGSTDATGGFQVWSIESGGVVQQVNVTNVVMFPGSTSTSPYEFERLHVNGYSRAPGSGTTSYPTFDDVYVATGDYAQARVEIGNASTYSSCTNLTPVTTTSWSDTSITGVVRGGSFSSGTAYIYVVDATGAVNSTGYQVVFGGGLVQSGGGCCSWQ